MKGTILNHYVGTYLWSTRFYPYAANKRNGNGKNRSHRSESTDNHRGRTGETWTFRRIFLSGKVRDRSERIRTRRRAVRPRRAGFDCVRMRRGKDARKYRKDACAASQKRRANASKVPHGKNPRYLSAMSNLCTSIFKFIFNFQSVKLRAKPINKSKSLQLVNNRTDCESLGTKPETKKFLYS